jgi:UDP-N-acetylmuramate dehydrogenase
VTSLDAAIAELRSRSSAIDIKANEPLAKRTTFAIGGPADVLVTAKSEHEIAATLQWCRDHQLPIFLLGGGSNLLIADKGVRGCVLTLSGALKDVAVEDGGAKIVVGAACSFPKLTRVAIDHGWRSAVGWIGTPGQVGGALKMNAGSRDGEIGDVVIEVIGTTADHQTVFRREDCGFRYRGSDFPSTIVLTSAILRCDNHRNEDAKALDLRARALLARRHSTQPKLRSAGSIFKNPPGDFAGRLIEAAGLKGQVAGRAQISEVHANFVVNLGGATATDVLQLASLAQDRVASRFGVELEWEVRRVGDFS